MARPVMFLRTAQTEQRIDELEKQVARIMDHLQLTDSKPPPDPDEDWEAAAPVRVAQSVERAGVEGSIPSPDTKPISKIAQKVAKRR